jgi:hypothetical protein
MNTSSHGGVPGNNRVNSEPLATVFDALDNTSGGLRERCQQAAGTARYQRELNNAARELQLCEDRLRSTIDVPRSLYEEYLVRRQQSTAGTGLQGPLSVHELLEIYNRLPENESLGAGIELALGDYLAAKAKYAALEYRHGISRWTAHTHSGLLAGG